MFSPRFFVVFILVACGGATSADPESTPSANDEDTFLPWNTARSQIEEACGLSLRNMPMSAHVDASTVVAELGNEAGADFLARRDASDAAPFHALAGVANEDEGAGSYRFVFEDSAAGAFFVVPSMTAWLAGRCESPSFADSVQLSDSEEPHIVSTLAHTTESDLCECSPDAPNYQPECAAFCARTREEFHHLLLLPRAGRALSWVEGTRDLRDECEAPVADTESPRPPPPSALSIEAEEPNHIRVRCEGFEVRALLQ